MSSDDGSVAQKPSRFRTDVLMMLGSRGIIILATGVGSIVMARRLGPSGRGTVAVAVSLILLLVYFGNVGLNIANPYYAARDPGDRARIVANAAWLTAALAVILVTIGVALKLWLPETLGSLTWGEFAAVLIAVPGA